VSPATGASDVIGVRRARVHDVDEASLAADYERIGFASHAVRKGSGHESRAAIDAARRVWEELNRHAE